MEHMAACHEEPQRVTNGGAAALHFQRFVSLTGNIGRFAHELADLQQSLVETLAALARQAVPSRFAALTF